MVKNMSEIAIQAAGFAKDAMNKGHNCCQAVLMSANSALKLNLSQDTLNAAVFFGKGMESGCACGALVGMVMASGIIRTKLDLPEDKQLPSRLHKLFLQQFKSTCCRVIRKNQPLIQSLGNQACIDLTSRAAAMLVQEWEALLSAANKDLRNNTNL